MGLFRMQWCDVGRAVPARKSKNYQRLPRESFAGAIMIRLPIFQSAYRTRIATGSIYPSPVLPQSCGKPGLILAGQLATADTVGRDHAQDEENTPKDAKRQERDHN